MTQKYVDDLNKQEISPEDMIAVLKEMSERPRDQRSFEGLVKILIDVLPDRTVDYRVALNFRLGAIDQLQKSLPKLGGFSTVLPEGGHLVHSSIATAAAKCRLVYLDDRTITFDEAEFITEAMRAATPEGSG